MATFASNVQMVNVNSAGMWMSRGAPHGDRDADSEGDEAITPATPATPAQGRLKGRLLCRRVGDTREESRAVTVEEPVTEDAGEGGAPSAPPLVTSE